MPNEEATQILLSLGRLEAQMTDLKASVSEKITAITVEGDRNRTNLHLLRDDFHKHLLNDSEKPCKQHAEVFAKVYWHEKLIYMCLGGSVVISILIRILFK